MPTLAELTQHFAQPGVVRWIGVRPERAAAMQVVQAVEARAGIGLVGDRYRSRGGARQVTLMQAEHLPVVAALMGREAIAPDLLRRNILVAGINLLALKGQRFYLGTATLEFSGLAHPCSRMEAALGTGGYNALRGHGGITARVCASGVIRVGDALIPMPPET